jgi:hypothetical protein
LEEENQGEDTYTFEEWLEDCAYYAREQNEDPGR